MMQPMHILIEEHGRIRSMLACFEAQLDLFEQAQQPNYEILEGSIAYCRDYLDNWHHGRENALFDLLLRRDPARAKGCQELDRQHAALAQMTKELVGIFDAVQKWALLAREDVVGRGRALSRAYHLHLEWEETHFFPVVEEVLLPEDWKEIATHFDDATDPLTQNSVDKRYWALFNAIADARAATPGSLRRI